MLTDSGVTKTSAVSDWATSTVEPTDSYGTGTLRRPHRQGSS